jgi:uncharacterized membrane protein YsdA (DUF1294 family)
MFFKIVLSIYAVMSLATFVAYGVDKRRAAYCRRRIPEKTLHFMELGCGWPGALAGQNVFRHKRRKGRFMAVFAVIVLLHAGLWYVAWRKGLVHF